MQIQLVLGVGRWHWEPVRELARAGVRLVSLECEWGRGETLSRPVNQQMV